MKDWWLNLSLRDKQMVILGSLVVMIFLIYTIIWSPLDNANVNLRSHIQHSRETLNFMQQADHRIQLLLKESTAQTHTSTESLLGTMQTEMNHSEFSSHVTQLREAENDSVQFNLTKIDFDQLLVFLTSVWKKYHFIVSRISVIPTGVPGEVTVDVTIKSS